MDHMFKPYSGPDSPSYRPEKSGGGGSDSGGKGMSCLSQSAILAAGLLIWLDRIR